MTNPPRIALNQASRIASKKIAKFFQPSFRNDIKLDIQLKLLKFLVVEVRHLGDCWVPVTVRTTQYPCVILLICGYEHTQGR